VRVQPGDTLRRIAAQTQPPGLSLDQMLVSLYRANPQAFINDNMNLLRSGAVLKVPAAEEVGRLDNSEARQIIRAQAKDFNAFRQRLAGAVTARAETAPTRQATGRVQTQVQERAAAAPAPDRLTLSRPTPQASAPAAQASSETERRDAANRAAELARNVETLRRLQGAASAPAVAAAPATPAPAPVAAAAPSAAPEATPPAAQPGVVLAPPPPVAVPASAPPEPVAAPPVAASEPAAPPMPAPPMPSPEQPPAEQELSLIDSVLAHPLALPGAGLVVVLLGGLAYFAIRSRRKQGRETSFLESRLQPDSFFGASGGQRIDTHDAGSSTTGNASSISYSLSQLDAIGDVDPVAEADVYLAYGRDLQAEEILKEAMRSDPDRMAIRTKLLEVYAKRRDVKGFELLATQLHSLTRGQGDDWAKAQALGLSIDPDNPLYQPGGNPGVVLGARGEAVEPLGASTMPYAAPAGPPSFQPAPDATLDLALDLELPAKSQTQQGQAPAAAYDAADSPAYEPELPTLPVAPPAGAPPSPAAMPDVSLDFDLGEPAAPQRVSPDDAALDFGDFGIEPQEPEAEDPEADALSRKLELAEEFRQIGDVEGARDLLEEVLAKAEGALRTKAQRMLDSL
jgi:pilus assembly protein FimV